MPLLTKQPQFIPNAAHTRHAIVAKPMPTIRASLRESIFSRGPPPPGPVPFRSCSTFLDDSARVGIHEHDAFAGVDIAILG